MSSIAGTRSYAETRGRSQAIFSDEFVFETALFFLPVLAAFNIRFMGQLLFSDLVIVPLMAMALVARGIPAKRLIHYTLLGAAMWLLALVASDILNQTPFSNLMRGWARNTLACFYLLFFVCALKPEPRSMTILAAGMAIGLSIQPFYLDRLNFELFLKFGAGTAGAWLICAASMYAWRRRRPILPFAVLFGWIVLALSQNVRSLTSVSLGALAFGIGAYYFSSFFRRMSVPTILFSLAITGSVAIAGMAAGYGALAGSGTLGRTAQVKYLSESSGGDLSSLSSLWNARPALRVAALVIGDSPILGHGSWYTDPQVTAAVLLFSNYVNQGSVAGLVRQVTEGEQAMGHSVILQSWVEAGIVGAAFWIIVVGICIAGALQSLRRPTILSPVLFIAAFVLIFDALFSPFGSTQRVWNMAELAVVLLIMTAPRRSDAERP